MADRSFRLGTRGSRLAMRQARAIERKLAEHRYDVTLVEVETEGDRIRDELISELGRIGAFVRDLDERVLAGDLDAAVHSMKDMPTSIPDELVVAAVPPREHPGDVLVTPDGTNLADLPAGATVGTGSLRRRAQLGNDREDLVVEPIRGNVDTRIEKLLGPHLRDERDAIEEAERDPWLADLTAIERQALDRDPDGRYDGLVLARAGLERSGLAEAVPTTPLAIERFTPAAGQGALAVTMRDGEAADRVQRLLDDPPSRIATTVERTILAGLGGGCIAPIGINAVVQGNAVTTRVQVLGETGDRSVRLSRELPIDGYRTAAVDLVTELEHRGADELVAAAARSTGDGP